MNRVAVVGGYGTFGRRIAGRLAACGLPVAIVGRDGRRADMLADDLLRSFPDAAVEAFAADVRNDPGALLDALDPAVVVNAVGPFQPGGYGPARACIRRKIHYIDLADSRAFVAGFAALDAEARAQDVLAVTGASTVPALSSAVIDAHLAAFARLQAVDYGIVAALRMSRGAATARSVLSCAGRRMAPWPRARDRFGWQDLRSVVYPVLGRKWIANCEIPDFDLLPGRFGLEDLRFGAGFDVAAFAIGLAALGRLIRWGVPLPLARWATALVAVSRLLDPLGGRDSGMHVFMQGIGADGAPLERRWFLIGRDGDGPYVPCVPAIVLARRLLEGLETRRGAMACVGLIDLDAYLAELRDLRIETMSETRVSASPRAS